jgi:hypothetical protein
MPRPTDDVGVSLFLTVRLAQGRETSKQRLARVHGITEHHEKTTNDGEVAEEEVEVEDEAVAKGLHNYHRKETTNRIFSISFRDNRTGANQHGL